MHEEIKEYTLAVEANLKASLMELNAAEAKRKAYYRLMRAKDAMKAREKELLHDCERNRE